MWRKAEKDDSPLPFFWLVLDRLESGHDPVWWRSVVPFALCGKIEKIYDLPTILCRFWILDATPCVVVRVKQDKTETKTDTEEVSAQQRSSSTPTTSGERNLAERACRSARTLSVVGHHLPIIIIIIDPWAITNNNYYRERRLPAARARK